jgi:Uma2 family endonuclease
MALVDMPLLTVEDYRNLPETGPRYQLIEGYLYMAPAPNRYHQEISRNLELILGKYLKRNPLGKFYHAPFDVVLGEFDVFQPDILFVSKARYGILTEAGAEGAPDFIVEILSPKTATLDLVNKKKQYTHTGVAELWIIDPKKRRIEIFHLQDNPRHPVAIHGEKSTFESRTFPGLTFEAAEIFAE